MHCPAPLRRWIAGWADLARHREVAGYRDRALVARLGLDLRCLGAAAGRPGTWRVVLWMLAIALAAQLVAWHGDLAGWRRDLLQCLPVLYAAPLAAAGRRRWLAARTAAAPETGVTDRRAERRHSPGSGGWRSAVWHLGRTMRWWRAGRASAGPTSSSSSPASGRWRPWRSRASRN